MPITYKLLVPMEVNSNLRGHVSPIELRDALITMAGKVDDFDDYFVLENREDNKDMFTLVSETLVDADFWLLDGKDDLPVVA